MVETVRVVFICLSGCGTKAVRRLFISVLAICYGGGGIQHCPTSLDLPKAKAIAVSLGTPNYNELPISISITHSLIYINKSGAMTLEATSQGLVARPKTLSFIPFHNPLFPLCHRHRPLQMASPPVLKRRNRVNAISPGPIDTPMTSGMVQRGTRRAIKGKPRERCAAAGVDGSPDEIAKAASFFASDDSNLITTGTELFVDGVWRKSEDLGTAGI